MSDMKKFALIYFALGLINLSSTAENIKSPPSMATIFATVNDHWSKKEYTHVKCYVEELDKHYRGYVPITLIESSFHCYWGAQIEQAIKSLDDLKRSLDHEIYHVSPMFMELLGSRRNRINSSLQAYERCNYTKEFRAEYLSPMNKEKYKPPTRWIDELLYFNAPEIWITANGVVEANIEDTFKLNKEFLKLSSEEILKIINLTEYEILTKKYLVKELIRRRAESDDVHELLKGLTEGATGYTYGETVKAMEKLGHTYIPEVIKLLDNPSRHPNESELWIWALVRMKATNEETLNALKKIASGSKDRQPMKDYAKIALLYLDDIKHSTANKQETVNGD